MKTNYVLIDFENVQVKSLALLMDDTFRVSVFLGPANSKLPVDLVLAMQSMGTRAAYITLETPGKNALDFHIAYYLGVMSKDDPAGFFHIISRDSGFDPLIQHLKGKKILAARSASIEQMPCFTAPQQPASSQAIVSSASRVAAQPMPPRVSAVAMKPSSAAGIKVATPAPPKDVKPVAVATPHETLIKAAMGDLIKRKASRPRTVKTLLSTIHATCGKELSESQVQAIYQALIKRGHVILEGAKVTYRLPSA